jgi:hypothetical protein
VLVDAFDLAVVVRLAERADDRTVEETPAFMRCRMILMREAARG